MTQQFHFWVYTQRMKDSVLKSYLHTHVHSSIIHNSWCVEGTQVSINRWMDKQNMVYTYNGLLFSLKNEGSSNVYYNPWGHYTKWNKPVTKRQTLYDSTYMRYLRVVKVTETEIRMMVARDCVSGNWGVIV